MMAVSMVLPWPSWQTALMYASWYTSVLWLPAPSTKPSRCTWSLVSVPVLSLQRTVMAPMFWMASRRLTMAFFLERR
jgi:hypothetical protein